jgi:hypothetical protein
LNASNGASPGFAGAVRAPAAAIPVTPRLAGFSLLVSFTVVLVTLLALVFPTGSEYAAFTSETKADAYSIAYLEVLTRANPKELDLRLVYGKQLATLGRYDDALAAIKPVLADAKLGPTAKHFAFDVGLARARALPEGDPQRSAAFVDVHGQLRQLFTIPRTPARSEELARLALELDDPRLGSEYYLDLAAQQPNGRAAHLASAARWLRAAGDNSGAATNYRSAHDSARSPDEAVEYGVLAIASVESDNRPAAAADLAAELVRFHPKDARILAQATRLATANSRAAIARDFGRRLLALAPDDDATMRDQAQRELAATDAKSSLQLLNKLVAKHPDEYGLHLQRARVSEWAGDLDTTQRDLLWLIAHRREAPPREAPPP